jgi:hypothetical protein
MKDTELRGIVLKRFYEERRRTIKIWGEKDLPQGIAAVDFFDVCGQLAQQGLITWEPLKGGFKITGGVGKITAGGVDIVEGNTQPPANITFNFDNSHKVSMNDSPNANIQVGNHNSFSSMINVEGINAAIDQSSFSSTEKAEAKNLLNEFLKHPLVTSIAGGIAGGLAARVY